ncbi:uncharacterized protein [Misgurnus anguillicaudatus]|uniref:uncharacterized protein isoform X1 n=1 Tax=Misgurnus anguillicaudatus TaxID=75329 RepID=UPI003CCFBA83
MSTSKEKLKTGSGARDARRKSRNSAPATVRVIFTLPGEVPDEEVPTAVRQNTILSTSANEFVTRSGVRDVRRRSNIATPAAGHLRLTLPGAVDDEEWSPEAVRQNTIVCTAAHGLVTSSGVRDVRQRSNISTPAAGHVRFALPGAVDDDEECSPVAVSQNTILSSPACGLVTGSGVRDSQRRLNISTPATSQESIAPQWADKEWSPEVVGQNILLSTTAHGLVTSSGARDVQRRLNISTPAASQESIALQGADEERREAENQTNQQKKKGILVFFQNKLQAIKRAFGIRRNEYQLDPADPQPGLSDLEARTREDQVDLQKGPSGLKPTGFQEPARCLHGSFTLEKTVLQEEADPKFGPFDPEPRAQRDQTFKQTGPFDLKPRARQDNWQYSPFGLEPAGHEEPVYCQAGSFSLENTVLQKMADPKSGPFDQEPRAQRDQTDRRTGPSDLKPRACLDNWQYSPIGLEPAGHEGPVYCQTGSDSLEKIVLQEEADPENGPFDPKPSAHHDQPYSQPDPSDLQSSSHQCAYPARASKYLYKEEKQKEEVDFGVYEKNRKSSGRKSMTMEDNHDGEHKERKDKKKKKKKGKRFSLKKIFSCIFPCGDDSQLSTAPSTPRPATVGGSAMFAVKTSSDSSDVLLTAEQDKAILRENVGMQMVSAMDWLEHEQICLDIGSDELTRHEILQLTQCSIERPKQKRVSDQDDHQKVAKGQQVEIKYMGFPNIGNTCFMNSTLQCLLNMSPIMQDIISQQKHWKNEPGSEMFKALYDLHDTRMKKTSADQKAQLLATIKRCIARRNSDFRSDDEQDAHEFLMTCLAQLNEEAKMCQDSMNDFHNPAAHMDFKIIRLRTCKTCGNQRHSLEELNCLSLAIGPQGSLMESLQHYFAASSFECRCSECGGDQALETVQVQTLPKVLVLLVTRFDMYTLEKIDGCLAVPKKLSLSGFTGSDSSKQVSDLYSQQLEDNQQIKISKANLGRDTDQHQWQTAMGNAAYKLTGVVSHLGPSLQCGHYISNISDPCGAGWMKCDDSTVKSISWRRASKNIEKHGYMFFYVRS